MINENILGFYVSYPSLMGGASDKEQQLSKEQGDLFSSYIWGNKGISDSLKEVKYENYGKDIILVLFRFHLKPLLTELEYLKPIENYRKSEKSIGIPIIVNDENFFSKSEAERYDFLKESIFEKLDLLAEVVKKKKLDTNMELLKSDLKNVFQAL